LQDALAHKPVMLIIQPRAHNPRGHALSRQRMARLGALLRGHQIQILEDDHSAYISSTAAVSLGEVLPEQTVLVRSFSKSHGPDLRLAAVGGTAEVIDEVVRTRYLGPGWSSHLLQALLHDMLTDDQAVRVVNAARETYRSRRETLAAALRVRGVVVEGGADGINMWIQVPDERSTLLSLGLQGIMAAPGSPFEAAPLPTQHIRLTYATLAARVDEVADAIAAATHGSARRLGR
jgi:DNA-binding transcriptional MocR family regulator